MPKSAFSFYMSILAFKTESQSSAFL